jgi:hypothetical protein
MIGRMEMPGGMLVLRIVAASDMSTGETEAQVDPRIPDSQTILTPIRTGCHLLYLV